MNNISLYEKLVQKSKNKVSDIVTSMSFDEAIKLAYEMLNNSEWDEALQEYATTLLEEIRKTYPKRWNESWKYDAFLGFAYDITLNYDERYLALKRAFSKVTEYPPPQLLVALAACCMCPGKPPITTDEAISFVKQAINKELYIEAVELLRGLYKFQGNSKEQEHWDKILEKIKNTGLHLPSLDQIF